MLNKTLARTLGRRLLLSFLLAAAFLLTFSEIVYRMMRNPDERGPQTIEITVPKGTAERIAMGMPVPVIPNDMIFVIGDTLLVRNEDVVPHQLGPLWIPAGSSASLQMQRVDDYVYSCTFQPTKYLGFTVRTATTWQSRLAALWYGTIPLTMFIFVYGLMVRTPPEMQRAFE